MIIAIFYGRISITPKSMGSTSITAGSTIIAGVLKIGLTVGVSNENMASDQPNDGSVIYDYFNLVI